MLSPELQESAHATLSPASRRPGKVGPFRILRLLGQGGSGTVYEAEREGPLGRKVALKVVTLRSRDEMAAKRFQIECDSLAKMDHVGIARVFEAGLTEEGQAFLAMELVEGVRFDLYCDQRRMWIRDRVKLFLGIVGALRHAHERGILHRDIKPSNVLVGKVDDKPHAKVIDFGLARMVNHSELDSLTASGEVLGTLAYISPEQARVIKAPVDERSDVFALGVLLYQVLTGCLPSDDERGLATPGHGLQSLESSVSPSDRFSGGSNEFAAERRSSTPIEMREALRDGLDWITLKAIEPHPKDRYQSVAELEADLQAYVESRPLLAGPPSRRGDVKRLYRRHRVLVNGVAAAVVALACTTAFSVHSAVQAREAQNKMEVVVADYVAQNDVFREMLSGASPSRGGSGKGTPVEDLLEAAVDQVDAVYADRPTTVAAVLGAVGTAYSGIDELGKAEELLVRAVENWRESPYSDPWIVGVDLNNLGIVYAATDRQEESIQAHTEAIEWLETKEELTERDLKSLAAWSFNLGRRLVRTEAVEQAGRHLKRCYEINLALSGEESVQFMFAVAGLADYERMSANLGEAEALSRKCLALAKKQFPGDDHIYIASCLTQLSGILLDARRYDEGCALAVEAFERAQAALPEGSSKVHVYHQAVLVAYVAAKDYDAAETTLQAMAPALKRRGGGRLEFEQANIALRRLRPSREGSFPSGVTAAAVAAACDRAEASVAMGEGTRAVRRSERKKMLNLVSYMRESAAALAD